MIGRKYTEILKINREIESTISGSKYEIALLSNIVVSQLKEILEYSLRVCGINAHVRNGDYDNIVQDSEKLKDSNSVIIFWELSNIIDGLHYKASLMNENEIRDMINKVKSEIDFIISNLKHTSLVLINKFSSMIFNYQNLKPNKFDEIGIELNGYLEQQVSSNSNIILIDISRVYAKTSIHGSIDLRYYYSSKALYTVQFYKEYSEYIRPIFLSANGKSRKALIFDCDNTLWKGILGEDGFDGIEMSNKSYHGTIFEDVQCITLGLSKKGVIIGICSKNNLHEVDNVVNKHPDMKIRGENIAIKKVNWNDKVSNIKEIAKELNIGLDSIVYIDDSDFEVNYVRRNLPEVSVLQVPKNLYEYPVLLRKNAGLFYNLSETKEDLKKIEMYKEGLEREEFKKQCDTIEDYLKSLGLKLKIFIDEKSLIPRMAQLTQKTNQFNLTTKRHTESDMNGLVHSDNDRVFAFEVEDRFGIYGVTGLSIVALNIDRQSAEIDTLLMSCRIIGRNIEYSFFDFIIGYLKDLNIKTVIATYIETLKNEQVKEFYEDVGFKLVSCTDKKKNYELRVKDYKAKNLEWVEILNGK